MCVAAAPALTAAFFSSPPPRPHPPARPRRAQALTGNLDDRPTLAAVKQLVEGAAAGGRDYADDCLRPVVAAVKELQVAAREAGGDAKVLSMDLNALAVRYWRAGGGCVPAGAGGARAPPFQRCASLLANAPPHYPPTHTRRQHDHNGVKSALAALRESVPGLVAARAEEWGRRWADERGRLLTEEVLPRLAALDVSQAAFKEQLGVHSQARAAAAAAAARG